MQRVISTLAVLGVLLAATGCQATDRALGNSRGDGSIIAAVKERLAQERVGSGTDIDVDTRDATVFLRGTVPTGEDKIRAARLARDVEGVQRVVNELRVDSTGSRTRGRQEEMSGAP